MLTALLQHADEDPLSEKGLAYRTLAAVTFPTDAPWKEFVGLAARTDPPSRWERATAQPRRTPPATAP